MEVYAYEFDNADKKTLIDEFFDNLGIVEINRIVADQAIIYRKNKTKKIKLPDAVILATAKILAADLLSDDWDDFQGIDASVNVVNLDTLRIWNQSLQVKKWTIRLIVGWKIIGLFDTFCPFIAPFKVTGKF